MNAKRFGPPIILRAAKNPPAALYAVPGSLSISGKGEERVSFAIGSGGSRGEESFAPKRGPSAGSVRNPPNPQ